MLRHHCGWHPAPATALRSSAFGLAILPYLALSASFSSCVKGRIADCGRVAGRFGGGGCTERERSDGTRVRGEERTRGEARGPRRAHLRGRAALLRLHSAV